MDVAAHSFDLLLSVRVGHEQVHDAKVHDVLFKLVDLEGLSGVNEVNVDLFKENLVFVAHPLPLAEQVWIFVNVFNPSFVFGFHFHQLVQFGIVIGLFLDVVVHCLVLLFK